MTSGGSSGSPVIDINGHAIGLNAGSYRNASIAYFLPLDQPVKCLQYIEKGELMPRGTIQTRWSLKPFHECQTLGINDDTVKTLQEKDPEEGTMLVVSSVLPEGPADSKISEGDVLLKINDSYITRFKEVSEVLDASVGKGITIILQRGDHEIIVAVSVQDLHEITPDRYIHTSKSTFHNFSYIYAERYRLPVYNAGVYTSYDCWDLGTGPFLIRSIDNKPTRNIQEFEETFQSIPGKEMAILGRKSNPRLDGKLVRVAYQYPHDTNRMHYVVTTIHRQLSETEKGVRDFNKGEWAITTLPLCSTAETLIAQTVKVATKEHPRYPNAAQIFYSLVWVTTFRTLPVDGFTSWRIKHYGIVVNEKLGHVLLSRDALPSLYSRSTIQFFGSIVVPAKIIFLHPVSNYAVLKYDPSLVHAPVKAARLSENEVSTGEQLLFFRTGHIGLVELCPAYVVGEGSISTSPIIAPAKSGLNRDILVVDTRLTAYKSGTGLISEDGIVEALFLGDHCVTTAAIVPILKQIETGIVPEFNLLGARFRRISMLSAIAMGLPQGVLTNNLTLHFSDTNLTSLEWIDRIEQTHYRQVFKVMKPYGGHESPFREGDIFLTLNDELVSSASDIFEREIQKTSNALVLRDDQLKTLGVTSFPTNKIETTRFLMVCGALIQEPHLAVRQIVKELPSEVYIAGWLHGSPTERWNVFARNFIVEINGNATPELDSFLKEVKKIEDNSYFRMTLKTTQNVRLVKTIKRDEHYFPLVEYVLSEDSEWETIKH